LVQLVSHAHNHDAGSELQHRPGSGKLIPFNTWAVQAIVDANEFGQACAN
jgi:hypothetical protein